VWWAARADATPELGSLLDDVERERRAAYRRQEDQDRFLVGCALAKVALGRRLDRPPESIRLSRTCPTCGKPHGKPALLGSGIELSLSHSGEAVALALAEGAPVGVDVEVLAGARFEVDELRRVALSDDEARALEGLDASERRRAFLVAWTRKEAVTKAVGAGLAVPLREVVVSPAHEPPRLLAWPYDDPPEVVSLFDVGSDPGYPASVAVLSPCGGVRELDGSELLRTFVETTASPG